MPLPVLASAVLAAPSWMMPEKVGDRLSPPVVSVAAFGPLLVTVPAPASPPIASLKPPRSSVVPVLAVSALPALKLLALPPFSVPPVMVVTPV